MDAFAGRIPRSLWVAAALGVALLVPRGARPEAQPPEEENVSMEGARRFQRVIRINLPLADRDRVSVSVDSISQTVEVRCGDFPIARQAELKELLAMENGTLLGVQQKKGETILTFILPVPNLQAIARASSTTREIYIELGSGRFLFPDNRSAHFSPLLPKDFPDRAKIIEVEQQIARGEHKTAHDTLEKLIGRAGGTAILACLLLMDLESPTLAGKPKMNDLSIRCLGRAKNIRHPLLPLAQMRSWAYTGEFLKLSEEQLEGIVDYPLKALTWYQEMALYERARLYIARGLLDKAFDDYLLLFTAFPDTSLERQIEPQLERILRQLIETWTKEGRYAHLGARILDAIMSYRVIADDDLTRYALLAAQVFDKAGLKKDKLDILMWRLKKTNADQITPDLIREVSATFIDSGDVRKGEITLDFWRGLDKAVVNKAYYRYLRAKVAVLKSDPEQAMLRYQEAVQAGDDPKVVLDAALEAATMLREQKKLPEALDILGKALRVPRVERQEERYTDLTIMLADLAYDLKQTELALHTYRVFVKQYPKDPRVSMARHRIAQLSANPMEALDAQMHRGEASDKDKDKDKKPDVWEDASEVFFRTSLFRASR